MEPQTNIPIVTDVATLDGLVKSGYSGLANVLLKSDIVEYILSLTHNQRTPVKSEIRSYTESFIKYGYECIQMIHIGKDGSLADGQHRLLALREVYENQPDFQPPWQYVMFGISTDRAKDLDNGAIRKARDVLRMADKCRDNQISSALGTWARLIAPNTARKILARELEERWDNGFKDIVNVGYFPPLKNIVMLNCHSYRPPSWVVACFYIALVTYGLEKTKEAYYQFYDGTDGTAPMVKFREWLIINRQNVGRLNIVSSEIVARYFGYFFYCIKKFIAEEPVNVIRSVKLGVTIEGRKF